MKLSLALILASPCAAQFGGIFDQFFGGGQQQQQQASQEGPKVNNLVENTYLDIDCQGYVCEDTLKCVSSSQECPCEFPDSQLKCEFPGKQGYVCISKPSNGEGPGCEFILDAFVGKI